MKPVTILMLRVVLLALYAFALPCTAAGSGLTPGGVSYRDLQVGTGPVASSGDVVSVHLTGWTEQQGNPEQAFFNTRRDRQPLSFVVGTPRVMAGWNEGVQGMRAGGRRLLRIPPELGIGARSFEDKVPANATLVFVMELLQVTPAH
jgi:peptidylprolyl isomerase